jgi:hypothetical protein
MADLRETSKARLSWSFLLGAASAALALLSPAPAAAVEV